MHKKLSRVLPPRTRRRSTRPFLWRLYSRQASGRAGPRSTYRGNLLFFSLPPFPFLPDCLSFSVFLCLCLSVSSFTFLTPLCVCVFVSIYLSIFSSFPFLILYDCFDVSISIYLSLPPFLSRFYVCLFLCFSFYIIIYLSISSSFPFILLCMSVSVFLSVSGAGRSMSWDRTI